MNEEHKPTVAEIALQSMIGHMTDEYERDLDALRQRAQAAEARVKELEAAINQLAHECDHDKSVHLKRSIEAENDDDWTTALAESKHAMALGWCEDKLRQIL